MSETSTQFSVERGGSPTAVHGHYNVFLPTLLVSLAVVASLGFQTLQLSREQKRLETALSGMDAQHQVAARLRASLDAVATATAKLAADGNSNAKVIVEELRKRGVTITPHAQPKSPP